GSGTACAFRTPTSRPFWRFDGIPKPCPSLSAKGLICLCFPRDREHSHATHRHLLSAKGQCAMKQDAIPPPVAPATLQDVADRLASDADLSEIRKRDLHSAVRTYGKLLDRPLSAIAIDPAELRRALDRMVPAQA